MLTAAGKIYLDANANGQYETTEKRWRQTVSIDPGHFVTFPDSSSRYEFFPPDNIDFQAKVQSPSPWYGVKPALLPFGSSQQSLPDADIRIVPLSATHDARVTTYALLPLRYNFPATALMDVENIGTLPNDSNVVQLSCPAAFQINDVQTGNGPASVTINGNQALIGLSGINPLEKRTLIIHGSLATPLPLGDTLVCTSALSSTPPTDADPVNNHATLRWVVTGSFDPNDITAFPGGEVPVSALDADHSLAITYLIRFQNTGNSKTDFVVLKSAYDANIQPETFRLIGSSAPCSIAFSDPNTISFSFANYALPPASIDSLGSQGFVLFQLQTRAGLVPGDVIGHSAAIYFDYNPAVLTNTALTTIQDGASATTPLFTGPSFQLYPNPVSAGQSVIVVTDPALLNQSLSVWDMFGRLLKTVMLRQTTQRVDLSELQPGVYRIEAGKNSRLLLVH